MWVDKDDVFADNKVREFKVSNPDAATHIRNISFAKSPYPPTSTRSQLLYHHALSCMSSDGNDDLAYEYPAGAIADSPIPLSQEHPVDTPVSVPIPIVDFTTLQPLNAVTPVTDLQGPPSERTPEQKLWDFKTRAQQYARDRESCDDVRISYLEFLETEAEDDLALARMIAG
jgi:hypothetical protein